MVVLIATTTISVLRRAQAADATEDGTWSDPYEEEEGPSSTGYVPVRTGVRADLSAPSGSQTRLNSGTDVRADAFLIADLCDLHLGDVVLDERTGLRYTMGWCINYDSPGHLIKASQATLTRFEAGD